MEKGDEIGEEHRAVAEELESMTDMTIVESDSRFKRNTGIMLRICQDQYCTMIGKTTVQLRSMSQIIRKIWAESWLTRKERRRASLEIVLHICSNSATSRTKDTGACH